MNVEDTKERLILTLLSGGPMYGLDMITQSHGVLKRGTIYVYLAHLEDVDLIESSIVEATNRRQYRLSDAGESVALTIQKETEDRTRPKA